MVLYGPTGYQSNIQYHLREWIVTRESERFLGYYERLKIIGNQKLEKSPGYCEWFKVSGEFDLEQRVNHSGMTIKL